MNCFNFGGNNCCLWILIILLILCYCGTGFIEKLLDNSCIPIIWLALSYCKNHCGGLSGILGCFGGCK